MKKALILGITGMDGSHMADLLLSKGYDVYGLERHKSVPNRANIQHLMNRIHIVKGDLTDRGSLVTALYEVHPDEVYNFAAQAFDGDSWKLSELTVDVNAIGVLHLLEAICAVDKNIRVHNAATSGMYGYSTGVINESHPFAPHSPYASAKVCAFHLIQNFRKSYGLFASSAICFTHESERRGHEFVTRKISDGVAAISLGLADKIRLGNITTKRDWGYAPEYCEGFWKMLQHSEPDDFVFATGKAHSVEDFIREAFANIGISNWQDYIEISQELMRVAEINYLVGDASKAKEKLGWEPTMKFEKMVSIMVQNDIRLLKERK